MGALYQNVDISLPARCARSAAIRKSSASTFPSPFRSKMLMWCCAREPVVAGLLLRFFAAACMMAGCLAGRGGCGSWFAECCLRDSVCA